jgi:para-nitrobenzyl esterase
VPYLLGSNAEEANGQLDSLGALLEAEGGYLGALRSRFGDRAEEIAALYPPQDFPPSELGPSELLALARAVGDYENVCPVYDTARRAAAAGAAVYLYNFARPDADPPFARLGADHTAEIGYVFGSIELPNEADREVARVMQGYWTRLARTGDPNGEDALLWPRYDDASDQRITFDIPIAVLAGFRRTQCEFWWSLYDEDF